MTVLLLCLMAYQVTGEALHEWIGIGMTVLVIIHQLLNRKWYGALFKGKYNPYRIITTVVNIALLLSFVLTAFCGMSMSGHAVPFLYGMTRVSFARRMHLSMSHWAFVLMGLHLGMHIPVMFARLHLTDKLKTVISAALCIVAGIGLLLFIRNGMPDYLFFRVSFAFLDYEKAGILVFVENVLMLLFWGFIGTEAAVLCRNSQMKTEDKKNPLLPDLASKEDNLPLVEEEKDDISSEERVLETESAAEPSAVFFTTDITAEGLVRIYEQLDWQPTGNVAVKISTGEPPASNYLRPELIGNLVQQVDGTIVECNTAYGGSRSSSAIRFIRGRLWDHGPFLGLFSYRGAL